MTEVYLAFGSNVGDSRQNIKKAIELLSVSINQIKEAPFYLSKAVGYSDQPDFLNTAIAGQTDLKPEILLAFIKNIERQIGRVERFRFGPREIDIDIILYGEQIIESGELTIPHSSFRDRDFVLQPLYDLNPRLIDPVSKRTVAQLLARIRANQRSITTKVDL